MTDLVRQEIAATSDVWVVKVGTRVLTTPQGTLNEERVASLAEELHRIAASGRKVALVSSGAVGAGMGQLGISKRPRDLAQLQAVAAIGQSYLVRAYDKSLKAHGRHAAQLLLTAEDVNHRLRYLNTRNTILKLFEFGAVPIINENDTVSVAELKTTFGDNDRLAALVTNLIHAPLLVILSDVNGLYDRDPKDEGAQVVPTVTKLDKGVYDLVKDRLTGLSKGGMASKLEAARITTGAGGNVIIASGREPGSLDRILRGESVGTLFLAQGATVPAWKRWIGYTVPPRGHLVLDGGARRAIESQGRSLLPIGIVDIVGDFVKGDVIGLRDVEGNEFARGLSNYDAPEVRKIRGLKSEQITTTLGTYPYDEVVHRDNLVVTSS